MAKHRFPHFDVIKGIAILIVVMGHVMIFGIHKIDSAFIFKITEKLHMPLFFFISGYFTYKLIDGKIGLPNIISRFKQLIIPFFCVSTLWIYYFPHSGIESPLNSTWEGLYSDGWKNGYWFTLSLFELILIYCAIVPLFNRIRNVAFQIAIVTVLYAIIGVFTMLGDASINAYIGLPLIYQFLPIFFAGIFARKYADKFNAILTNNIAITTSILLGGFFLYYTCYFWEFHQITYSAIEIATSLVHFAVVILVFTVIKPWSDCEFSKESPSKIIKVLQYLGKESLAIYLLHYFFLFPMTSLRQPMIDMAFGFVPMFVVSFIVSCAIIAIVLGIKSIISKSKLLSMLILGK